MSSLSKNCACGRWTHGLYCRVLLVNEVLIRFNLIRCESSILLKCTADLYFLCILCCFVNMSAFVCIKCIDHLHNFAPLKPIHLGLRRALQHLTNREDFTEWRFSSLEILWLHHTRQQVSDLKQSWVTGELWNYIQFFK